MPRNLPQFCLCARVSTKSMRMHAAIHARARVLLIGWSLYNAQRSCARCFCSIVRKLCDESMCNRMDYLTARMPTENAHMLSDHTHRWSMTITLGGMLFQHFIANITNIWSEFTNRLNTPFKLCMRLHVATNVKQPLNTCANWLCRAPRVNGYKMACWIIANQILPYCMEKLPS